MHFVEMVSEAGIVSDLVAGMKTTTNLFEFWSSSQSLQSLLHADEDDGQVTPKAHS